MTALNAKRRNALPDSAFAGPDRSFPVDTHNRAANAKARATQAVDAGRMSPDEAARIKAKANRVLGKSSSDDKDGGRRKRSAKKLDEIVGGAMKKAGW